MQRAGTVLSKASGTVESLLLSTRQQVLREYRWLLREISYVPDELARQWLKQDAIHQFHRQPKFATGNAPNDAAKVVRRNIEKQLATVRKATVLLRRAHAGEREAFMKVAKSCYGRTGRRRRQLLAPLLSGADEEQRLRWLHLNETPEANHQGALMSMLPAKQSRKNGDSFRISPLLRRLGQSQIRSQIEGPHGKLRRIGPEIPDKNVWYRPFPEKRRKKRLSEGYATFLDKLHVPLPEADRRHLLQIISGQKAVSPPKRRSGSKHITNPFHPLSVVANSDWSRTSAAYAQLAAEKRLPARSIKRIYEDILSACPRLIWNEKQKFWQVSWGDKT